MKKYVAFLLWEVCLISLIVVFTSSNSKNKESGDTAVTATASGNDTTAQAAGHDINNRAPESTLQQVLNLKDMELAIAAFTLGLEAAGSESDVYRMNMR